METLEFDQDGRRVYQADKVMPEELYQKIKDKYPWVKRKIKRTQIGAVLKYKGFTVYEFEDLDTYYAITKKGEIYSVIKYYLLGWKLAPEYIQIKEEIEKIINIEEIIKRS